MRRCDECGNPLPIGMRPDAAYCSGRCRMRALRAKTKGVAVTGYSGPGYQAVTDNPPPARSAPVLQPELVEQLIASIPADLTIPKFLRREPDAPHWKLLDALADQ